MQPQMLAETQSNTLIPGEIYVYKCVLSQYAYDGAQCSWGYFICPNDLLLVLSVTKHRIYVMKDDMKVYSLSSSLIYDRVLPWRK